jgi:hypothetical protein
LSDRNFITTDKRKCTDLHRSLLLRPGEGLGQGGAAQNGTDRIFPHSPYPAPDASPFTTPDGASLSSYPTLRTWFVFYRRPPVTTSHTLDFGSNPANQGSPGRQRMQFNGHNRVIYGKLIDKPVDRGQGQWTMGRTQKPLDRDGSPVREFAFWLRDLRKTSGLTYEQLGNSAHYATSTVQEATAGRRLPTLRVTLAFVKACGGDHGEWRAYWAQIQRALDQDAPDGCLGSILPPWAGSYGLDAAGSAGDVRPSLRAANATAAGGDSRSVAADAEGWFVESFSALLRLDTEPVEALEQRVIVAASDGLSELATSVSVPRHPTDADQAHSLESELLHGGSLALREQPYESYFKNVIVLPRPLGKGERHGYALRFRIPAGQRMASH